MQRLWQKPTPTVTVAPANEEFRMPGPAATESSRAAVNVTQSLVSRHSPWTLNWRCALFKKEISELKVKKEPKTL